MKKVNKKLLLITTIICLLPILAGLMFYKVLPDQIPSHWNANGEINGYLAKNMFIFALPLGMAALNFIVIVFTHLDPKNKNNSNKIMHFIYWIIPVMTILVTTISYVIALGNGIKIDTVPLVLGFTGLLLIVIGNYLPKIKPNYTIGIKVPWTLNDDDIWYATHRMAGPLWFAGGLIIFLGGLFLKTELLFIVLMIVVVIITIVPIVYSYYLYKNKNEE